jgi:hypothetical protein
MGENQAEPGADRHPGADRPERQVAGHDHQRLEHHGGGGHLQPVQHAVAPGRRQDWREVGERDHRDRGRQGESQPGREQPGIAGAALADRHPKLAGGRPGQELGQRQQVGECGLGEPGAAFHELAAEIADMRHRAAERGQPLDQEGRENLPHRAGRRRLAHWVSGAGDLRHQPSLAAKPAGCRPFWAGGPATRSDCRESITFFGFGWIQSELEVTQG